MKRLPQIQSLQKLRATLEHFDHSADFGDGADVAVIKQFLQLRIREAEGHLRIKPWIQPQAA